MRLWGGEESGRFARIPQLPNGNGFRDLVEDAVRGIEGVNQLLEDHSNPGPTEKRQLPFRKVEDVDPAEGDLPGDDASRGFRQQARDGVGQCAFSGSRLTDDPHDAARVQPNRDPGQGVESPRARLVLDGEVLDIQHRFDHRRSGLCGPGNLTVQGRRGDRLHQGATAPRIEDVSEAVPEQAKGQDRDENGRAGSEDGPRGRQEELLVGLDHRAPLGYVQGHADSDEGYGRERDDDGPNVEGVVYEERLDQVPEDMTKQDSDLGNARRS